jgi:1-hydroxy-2-naphthoate dioxygenase
MAHDLGGLDLDQLNAWMHQRNLSGGWMRVKTAGQNPAPSASAQPAALAAPRSNGVVKWADLYPALLRGGELVPLPYGPMEMRTAGGRAPEGLTLPISMSAQILMPGERTRAHRNSKNETRLVVEAPEGARFVCDGEAFPMERGDVVISPTWTTHDHENAGDAPAVWVEAFDWGYSSTGVELNERYLKESPYQKIDKGEGFGLRALGRVGPIRRQPPTPRPAVRYPWAETKAALDAMLDAEVEPDPYDGIQLMFRSPVDGGPTLPTMAWHVQLLTGHRKTGTHRHNSTTWYHVFHGEGSTMVEGNTLEWTQGDIFAVPPWSWHHHENHLAENAILFSVDDWPARLALGFYSEEEFPI